VTKSPTASPKTSNPTSAPVSPTPHPTLVVSSRELNLLYWYWFILFSSHPIILPIRLHSRRILLWLHARIDDGTRRSMAAALMVKTLRSLLLSIHGANAALGLVQYPITIHAMRQDRYHAQSLPPLLLWHLSQWWESLIRIVQCLCKLQVLTFSSNRNQMWFSSCDSSRRVLPLKLLKVPLLQMYRQLSQRKLFRQRFRPQPRLLKLQLQLKLLHLKRLQETLVL